MSWWRCPTGPTSSTGLPSGSAKRREPRPFESSDSPKWVGLGLGFRVRVNPKWMCSMGKAFWTAPFKYIAVGSLYIVDSFVSSGIVH